MSVFTELSPPYSTIVADPPWHYAARPIGGATPGSMAKAQPFPYSTMSISEICALPVGALAADDAVLWLWTTNRWLREAFSVVDAWGFSYRQTLVWGKNNPMPVGSVAPSAAEFLMVAKRGKPAMEWVFPSSVIVTSRPSEREHSVKPNCFMDYVEAASPAPRVELFCRRPRLGWDHVRPPPRAGSVGALPFLPRRWRRELASPVLAECSDAYRLEAQNSRRNQLEAPTGVWAGVPRNKGGRRLSDEEKARRLTERLDRERAERMAAIHGQRPRLQVVR